MDSRAAFYPQAPALLTAGEVSERLNVSAQTVARLIQRGQLEAHRISDRNVRITSQSVERLLEATRMAGVDTRDRPGVDIRGQT